MTFEHPRLLAVSLTIALIGTSCSAPIDASKKEPIVSALEPSGSVEQPSGSVDQSSGSANQPSGSVDQPSGSVDQPSGSANGEHIPASASPVTVSTPPGQQDPPTQKPKTIAEQRAEALVDYWLGNARKLRTRGNLKAAKFELLKAKNQAPNNQIVAVELAGVVTELGDLELAIKNGGGAFRPSIIAAQRARASIQHQLQSAQQRMSDKDYAGAIDELRRAALGIETKNDIDWGDLPAQVQKAREQAERLRDGQAGGGQASEQRAPR